MRCRDDAIPLRRSVHLVLWAGGSVAKHIVFGHRTANETCEQGPLGMTEASRGNELSASGATRETGPGGAPDVARVTYVRDIYAP